jgi:hypothetical protein
MEIIWIADAFVDGRNMKGEFMKVLSIDCFPNKEDFCSIETSQGWINGVYCGQFAILL